MDISFIDFFIDPVLQAPTLGSMLMALSSALVGVLVFVRRRSLIGESLSHAAYPGVVLSLTFLSHFFHPSDLCMAPFILGGAFLFSFLGLLSIEILEKKFQIHSDAALCLILSTFLGLGVLVASQLQLAAPLWYRHIYLFLYGQTATMTNAHVVLYAILSFFILLFVLLKFRQIQLIAFDFSFARNVGIEKIPSEGALHLLLILAIVIGMRSVGVVLMSGMLIAPAVAARQFTNRLSGMFLFSSFFALLSGFGGNYLSIKIPTWMAKGGNFSLPTGPMILLIAALFAFLSLLFAPSRGLVSRLFRILFFQIQCLEENVLKTFWKKGAHLSLSVGEILHWNQVAKGKLWWILFRLKQEGWIEEKKKKFFLTSDGIKRATHLIRLHRLWEVYLSSQLKMGEERVHRNAEEMEHIITPELEKELTKLLKNPQKDPHHQPIPQKEELP